MSNLENPNEQKKRGRKPKKQLTPEEMKQMLLKSKNELIIVLQDLESEHEKVKPLNLKRLPELITTTIENLKDDLAEIEEHLNDQLVK